MLYMYLYLKLHYTVTPRFLCIWNTMQTDIKFFFVNSYYINTKNLRWIKENFSPPHKIVLSLITCLNLWGDLLVHSWLAHSICLKLNSICVINSQLLLLLLQENVDVSKSIHWALTLDLHFSLEWFHCPLRSGQGYRSPVTNINSLFPETVFASRKVWASIRKILVVWGIRN